MRTSSEPGSRLGRAARGGGGHVRSRYMSPMGLYAGLNGNNVRHFRCVDREKLWEVTMRKLFWLLALACLPTVALAQNAGPDWAYPVAPAGGPPRDANKILKVPGSDKTYNEVSANDAFAPPDWFPSEHAPMPTVVATGKKPDVRSEEHTSELQ